jgi:hypothetical protein
MFLRTLSASAPVWAIAAGAGSCCCRSFITNGRKACWNWLSCRPLPATCIELLTQLETVLGMAMHSARKAASACRNCLRNAGAGRRIQSQHQELEHINAELEAQAEKLQASEEELKVQQEELMEANQELEERTRLLEERNISLHSATAISSKRPRSWR